MAIPRTQEPSIEAARRELHELTILAGALVRLAMRVQARCDDLRTTLGDTAALREEEYSAILQPEPRVNGEVTEVAPEHDAATLLAMSMMGSGRSRQEVRDYLAQAFQLDDPDAVLDRATAR